MTQEYLIFTGLGLIVSYLVGVKVGKKYSNREITLDFQKIIHKLLHFAAERDYPNLHLMLHDLVDDEDKGEPPQPQKEPDEEVLPSEVYELTQTISPKDRKDAEEAVKKASEKGKEETD